MEKSTCTLKDVARLAGVSVGTASKVINNIYVNPKSKQAVDRAIEELGYIPNALARGLKGSSTKTIGVMIPDISNPINSSVLKGIEEASQSLGYSVLFSDSNLSERGELEVIKLFYEKQVDGIIYASNSMSEEVENALIKTGTPIVLIMTSSKKGEFSSVTMDNEMASYEMTKYLLSKNHKKILLLSGHISDENSGYPRLNGYKKALEEAGLVFDENLVMYGTYSFERGYQDIQKAITEGKQFTAVFAVADTIAIGAMHALHKLDIKVPEQISVAGFDGIAISNYVIPSLCTIAQPFKEYGIEGTRLLIDRIQKHTPNQHKKLTWKMVENESTKIIE